MGIKWRKKKNQDKLPVTTLKAAYELLGIEKFPVTYDEVYTCFYVKTIDSGLSKEQKTNYQIAKEMILSKLSTNPFTEENFTKTEPEDREIGLKKESFLEKIKKKLFQLKCLKKKVRKTKEQTAILEKETEFIVLKKKKHFSKKKKITLLILLLIIVSMFLIFKSSDMVITEAESIELLETQGVKLDNKTITVELENICNYEVKQRGFIPGINICILERNYLFSTKNILTRISSLTIYKSEISETGRVKWKKIWEKADDCMIDTEFSGTWSGSFSIGGKELKEAVLTISMTEHGYIEGIFSFKLDESTPGEIEVVGKYDKTKNEFSILGLNWIKRPSLFMTPTLNGFYDYQKEALVSSEESSSIFELKRTETERMSIFPSLLEEESALYRSNGKNHKIKLGRLSQFDYTIESKTGKSVEISYTGVTNRNIVNFKISGNAIFEKTDLFYVLKSHDAMAEYLSTSITGTYNGTEWVLDEEYDAVYEVYFSESEERFLADVTLVKPFKIIKEKRVITFVNGGIKSGRIDVLSDRVVGDGEAFALMDYERDCFCSDKNLILNKQLDTMDQLIRNNQLPCDG